MDVGEAAWAPELRAFAEELMSRHEVPGLAAAVAVAGNEVFAQGFGVRELGKPEPVTADTVFGVASVTKSFTALAIMQLAEAGKLQTDDPVTRYLPEFRLRDPDAARAVTLHNFLTHSAGLPPLPSRFFAFAHAVANDPYAPGKPDWEADHGPLESFEDLMEYLAQADYRLLGPPGAQFSYSNEGFVLLGAIIERVSGESYADYVRRHILEPAGMTRSTFDEGALRAFEDRTTFHTARTEEDRRTVLSAPYWALSPVWAPAGDLNTTVRDLLRYLEIYRTGGLAGDTRLLSPEAVSRMISPHIPTNVPGTYYGYGFTVMPGYHGVTVVQHGGGRKGIAANVLVAPEIGLTAAAVANLDGVPSADVTLAAVNRSLGLPADAKLVEHRDAECAPELLARYAGTYRGGERQDYTFAVEGETLVCVTQNRRVAVRHVGEHAVVLDMPGRETFGRFLLHQDEPARAFAVGSRIVPRYPRE